jgi:hypothetical protein
MKRQKRHDSYRFSVPSYMLKTFLDDKLWPDGISFRKFIYFRPKSEDVSTQAK